jgi:hypothetical protein
MAHGDWAGPKLRALNKRPLYAVALAREGFVVMAHDCFL